jgi:hypothetical protein
MIKKSKRALVGTKKGGPCLIPAWLRWFGCIRLGCGEGLRYYIL